MTRSEQRFEPEGFRVAWARFRWNIDVIFDRIDYYLPCERRRAWGDLTHSYVNLHVEAVREVRPEPEWLPKVLGKGIVGIEIGAIIAFIATAVMVAT